MKFTRLEHQFYGYIVPALSALFFICLIAIAIFSVRYKTKQFSGEAMVGDVAKLAAYFDQINKDCTILSFDFQQNPINFLTVGSFSGSEVGSMNLAHPEKWQGPYVPDNIAMQGKEYQIVRTDAGYFIVPGNGVILPDGKIIDKDLILGSKADIPELMLKGRSLNYDGKPMAASIVIGNASDKGLHAYADILADDAE